MDGTLTQILAQMFQMDQRLFDAGQRIAELEQELAKAREPRPAEVVAAARQISADDVHTALLKKQRSSGHLE